MICIVKNEKSISQAKIKAEGQVIAISVSHMKGIPKKNVYMVRVLENYGIEGDSHGGLWHRQISFLDLETIKKIQNRVGREVHPGELAENVTVDVSLSNVNVGDIITVGQCAFEVTQIGKKCHKGCRIFKRIGDCEMRKKGVFARVIKGGTMRVGDKVTVFNRGD